MVPYTQNHDGDGIKKMYVPISNLKIFKAWNINPSENHPSFQEHITSNPHSKASAQRAALVSSAKSLETLLFHLTISSLVSSGAQKAEMHYISLYKVPEFWVTTHGTHGTP